jgi:diketogulonate reductase-like aldo/keto reductase
MIDLHTLNDKVAIAPGVAMPRLGVGTYKAVVGGEVENEVAEALSIGYRGIDTAALYRNEDGVGRMVRASGIPRDELFIATKVWNSEQGYDLTLEAFDDSLGQLGMDHVELYLMHWPIPSKMRDAWRAMEAIQKSGRARAIGVCNFLPHHLEELLSLAEIPPAVDQVEFHPRLQQPELQAFCREHGIVQQAWAPLMRGGVFRIPELVEIAERHGKTAAQVSIRWTLQLGVTAIPKSVHAERLRENADVYDFELTAEEMATIASLDTGERIGPHPDRHGMS